MEIRRPKTIEEGACPYPCPFCRESSCKSANQRGSNKFTSSGFLRLESQKRKKANEKALFELLRKTIGDSFGDSFFSLSRCAFFQIGCPF